MLGELQPEKGSSDMGKKRDMDMIQNYDEINHQAVSLDSTGTGSLKDLEEAIRIGE